MSGLFLLEQSLNGVQLGVTLFLMAAGLTLVLGIMSFVNLAHGSFFMLGAYAAVSFQSWTGSFVLATLLAMVSVGLIAIVIEWTALRPLFSRSHLDQVLSTVGLLLFLNEGVRILWGPNPLNFSLPPALSGSVEIASGLPYPTIRLFVIGVGLVVAVALYIVIVHTKLGMTIRAGAYDRVMVGSMGVNIKVLNSVVFGVGAALAALAGLLAAPLTAVQSSMGDRVLILTLVVIVIGGIGSIRGAFVAALLVGLADTMGRTFLPGSLASVVIYGVMAAVLFFKPEGLFGERS